MLCKYGQIEKTIYKARCNDQRLAINARESAAECDGVIKYQECKIHGERAYSLSFMYLTKDFLCTRPMYCPFWRTQR